MAFVYWRTVRFQDTDAAGVVYFANLLSICHEAYEASLAATGIDLNAFFRNPALAVPIVHAEADYMQPMLCGKQYAIQVLPTALGDSQFKIQYRIFESPAPADQAPHTPQPNQIQPNQIQAGRATTVHVCIHPQTKHRQALSAALQTWLKLTQPDST